MFEVVLAVLLLAVFLLATLRMAGQVISLVGGSTANIGYGSLAQYSTDGAAWNNVVQVVDISGPDVSVKAVQVTNVDSPNPWHEKIPGLADAGQVTLACVYKKVGYANLVAQLTKNLYWRLTYVDGSTWTTNNGFITKIGNAAKLEDAQTFDVTLEWSGKPTLT